MTSTAGENALRIKKKPASLGLNSLGNLVTTVLRLSNLQQPYLSAGHSIIIHRYILTADYLKGKNTYKRNFPENHKEECT